MMAYYITEKNIPVIPLHHWKTLFETVCSKILPYLLGVRAASHHSSEKIHQCMFDI